METVTNGNAPKGTDDRIARITRPLVRIIKGLVKRTLIPQPRRVRVIWWPCLLLFAFSTPGCGQKTASRGAIVRSYVDGLVTGKLDLVLSYNYTYSQSVQIMRRNFPRQEWPQQLADIRRKLEAEIQGSRQTVDNINYPNANCFYWIRPGTTVTYLDSSPDDSRGVYYNTFLRLQWSRPEAAPVIRTDNGLRRLKEASIKVTSFLDPVLNGYKVMSCKLRTPPAPAFWPVDVLPTETALRLFKESVDPRELQPFASLLDSGREQLGGLYLDLPVSASKHQLNEIEGFLRKHEFSILGSFDAYHVFPNEFKVRQGYGGTGAAVAPPESWGKYRLPGFGNYRLFESMTYEVIAVQQNEGNALAEIKVSYEGCTPICEFIKDYWRLSVAPDIGRQFITRIVLPGKPDLAYQSRSYYGTSWPTAVTFEVSYSYDPRSVPSSWKLVSYRGK
jgi:hypothetical protein